MSASTYTPFFSPPANLEALRLFSRTLRTYANASDTSQVAKSLLQIAELMISNAARFDEYCTFNIESIGDHFMRDIREFPELTDDRRSISINSTFTSAFRFLCELEFTQPGNASFEVLQIGNFVEENMGLFSGSDQLQITFARYRMPVQVAKKLINDPSIAEFRNFSQTVADAKKLRSDWDLDLGQRRLHVDLIMQGLKNAKSSYNFVGLVDGFRNLATVKIKEREFAFWSLIALAISMVSPPAAQVFYVFTQMDAIEAKKGLLLYTLPTILAIEVMLVYFFRVVLAQFRSVKAQVLQLDLRIALCQFVQSYAEYSTTIKKDDPNVLAKFEAVVFSNLVPDGEGIPSTFDGTEQIANLIRSVRGT